MSNSSQPDGFSTVMGRMDAVSSIGLDWRQAEEGRTGTRSYIKTLPLWYSLARDAGDTE